MKNDAVIFLVNTLSNGGAERVVANMASACCKKYHVFIITLYDENTYNLDDEIEVISLYNKKISKKMKIIHLFSIVHKTNKLINKIAANYNIKLITSHLIYSNLIAKLSKYRTKIINVIHVSYKSYTQKFNLILRFIFKQGIKFLYKNVLVVSVSKGCQDELLNIYKIKPLGIKTIYNPLNIAEIDLKKEEPLDINYKYFLTVGRFNRAKRQDRMLEVFYQGQFYKQYKLVFCGTGELEDDIKALVKKYKLEDYVYFMGWQDNIYKWLKNAELLVSTSDYEAFPMNLIEAFYCGTKVVSSNCSFGPDEIMLDDYASYLVPYNDIKAYIAKINLALKTYPRGQNPIIYKCNPENIISEYLTFMEEKGEKHG